MSFALQYSNYNNWNRITAPVFIWFMVSLIVARMQIAQGQFTTSCKYIQYPVLVSDECRIVVLTAIVDNLITLYLEGFCLTITYQTISYSSPSSTESCGTSLIVMVLQWGSIHLMKDTWFFLSWRRYDDGFGSLVWSSN